MINIHCIKDSYRKKPGTSTVWELTESETLDMDEQAYTNCVEAAPFFRRLGGSEYLERGYTSHGYRVVKIISTSPGKTEKHIRRFSFTRK